MSQEGKMSEKIIIRQNKNYETSFSALEPDATASDKPFPVSNINELSPYGMVLAGLGTCTAFVVNTYAEHHGIAVDAVELKLDYGRAFKEDCDHCEEIDKYEDQINMVVRFEGKLTSQEREKLFKISLHCPVHKMLKSGIRVASRPG
jgi:putative redox protein